MPIARSAQRASFYEAFRRFLAEGGPAVADGARFHENVRSSDMRYAGEPLDVAFFPIAIGDGDLAFLADRCERSLALIERATRTILGSPELRAEYGWPAERWRVVAHDPGYPLAVPCARFDSYWDGARDVKFLEVNTDGTSGMTNVERVTAFFLESPSLRPFTERFGIENFPLRERVLDTLLGCYATWRQQAAVRDGGRGKAPPERPRIAIVDWRTVKTSAEFRAFVRYFEEHGLQATIADPRELAFDGETLRADRGAGPPIDLVYRRVVSTEYFGANPQDVRGLTDAYLAGAVCIVGSFRSDIAFDKRFLAFLSDPVQAPRLGLTEDEAALAAEVVPWTRILRPGPVLEQAKRERERFVVKPAGLYEGRGVRIGVETDDVVWRAALEEAAPGGEHVVQERIVPPEITVEVLRDGRFQPKALYLSLGEYGFGGKLIGFNARVASTLVLSADDDERLLPVVRLRGS